MMDFSEVPRSQPKFNFDGLSNSQNINYTNTDSLPHVYIDETQPPVEPDEAHLVEMSNTGSSLAVLVLQTPYFNDDVVTNVAEHAAIPGTGPRKYLFKIYVPGIYHIGPSGVIKIDDHKTLSDPQHNPLGTESKPINDETRELGKNNDTIPKESLKVNSDSGLEIQEHGKSDDWWKESRWMKVRAIQEAVGPKPLLDYCDLRKNWRRFAVLSAQDKTLRFNTPRLRSLRRAVFGEQMGLPGMKYRRDTGIDYGKKEKVIFPPLHTLLPRKKNKQPPVFRGVPKVFYDWSRNPRPRLQAKRREAPQKFYDWVKMMDEKKQRENDAELSDFQRFIACEARRDPRSDFESFLRARGTDITEGMNIFRYKYDELALDPEVTGFGGYEDETITSSSDGESDNDGEEEISGSSFNESEDEYLNDDLASMSWDPEEF